MEGAFQDRRTLRRIAATLLALALLAERAAGRSFAVRFIVLAILGRAEAVGRAFVAGEIEADCPDLPCFDEPPAMHYGAADAERLALRLRMLAAVLGMLAGADVDSDGRAAGRSDVRSARSGGTPNLPLILFVRLPATRRSLRPHDTS